jgi:two-component sensor histidine kinase
MPSPLDRLLHRVPLVWLLQLAGWGAFVLVMALSRIGAFPLPYMVASKGTLGLTGLLVTLGLRALYRRVLPPAAPIGRIVLVSVVASYLASLVWVAVNNVASAWYAGPLLGRRITIDNALELFNGAVYEAMALLAWSLLYFGIKHYRALQAERERALRAEALAHEARLRALRYQLNPHFLFNTLNAISTLVVERRTGEATRMLARLSDFLRLTLESGDAQEVPLDDELEFALRYLEIERVRFGERLTVRVEVEPEARSALVPAMLLQPLVENAVKHAVAPREGGGTIALEARRAGGVLRLVVADDGPGLAGDAHADGRGIGLANTRERLRQLYGAAHRLTLEPAPAGGLRVVVELPLRGAPGRRPAEPAAAAGAAAAAAR